MKCLYRYECVGIKRHRVEQVVENIKDEARRTYECKECSTAEKSVLMVLVSATTIEEDGN